MAAPTIGNPDPYSLSKNLDRQAEVSRGFANTAVSALNAVSNAKAVMEQIEVSRANRAAKLREEQRMVSLANKRKSYLSNYHGGGLDYDQQLKQNIDIYGDNRLARQHTLRQTMIQAGDDEGFLSGSEGAMSYLNQDDYDNAKFDNQVSSLVKTYNIQNDARFDLTDKFAFVDRNGQTRNVTYVDAEAVNQYNQVMGTDLDPTKLQEAHESINEENLKFTDFTPEEIKAQTDRAKVAGDIAKVTRGSGGGVTYSDGTGTGRGLSIAEQANYGNIGKNTVKKVLDEKERKDVNDDLKGFVKKILTEKNLSSLGDSDLEVQQFYDNVGGKLGRGTDFATIATDLGIKEAVGLHIVTEMLVPPGKGESLDPVRAKIAEDLVFNVEKLIDDEKIPPLNGMGVTEYLQSIIDDPSIDAKRMLKDISEASMSAINKYTDVPGDESNAVSGLVKSTFGKPFRLQVARPQRLDDAGGAGAGGRSGSNWRKSFTGIEDPETRALGAQEAREALTRADEMTESNRTDPLFHRVLKRFRPGSVERE